MFYRGSSHGTTLNLTRVQEDEIQNLIKMSTASKYHILGKIFLQGSINKYKLTNIVP